MKTALPMAFLGAALLGAGPSVRLEAEGIRLGEVLIQGPALEVKETGGTAILVSGSVVEPLAAAVEVEVAPGRILVLEPGIRAQRSGETLVLSTHGRRRILLGSTVLETPVALTLVQNGWKSGETVLEGTSLVARLQDQDTDRNLDALREAARRIQQARERRPAEAAPRRTVQRHVRPRMRRVFGEDPVVTAEAVDSPTLRFLPQISPGGF